MTTYRDAILEATVEAMEQDEGVVLYGIGVPDKNAVFGTVAGCAERWPERVLDSPLCEDSLVGMGLGMAMGGLRPVNIHIRADFLLLAMNQIANMASSYQQFTRVPVPLTIRAIVGRGWGQGWHHSKSMMASFAHIPGIDVAVPATPSDAKHMLLAAIRGTKPTIIFEHRWLYWAEGEIDEGWGGYDPRGVYGDLDADVQIVAVGLMVAESILAAQILASVGVKAHVVNMRYLKPVSHVGLSLAVGLRRGQDKVVVAEDDWSSYGAGAEIAMSLYEMADRKIQVKRMGWKNRHVPTSKSGEENTYCHALEIALRAAELVGIDLASVCVAAHAFESISHGHPFKGPF